MRVIGQGVSPIRHAGGLGGGGGYALGEIGLFAQNPGVKYLLADGTVISETAYPNGYPYAIPGVADYAASGYQMSNVLPGAHSVDPNGPSNLMIERSDATGVVLAISTYSGPETLHVSRSIDGGKTFTRIATTIGGDRYLLDLTSGPAGTWYAVTMNASYTTSSLFKSTDDGATWTNITAALRNYTLTKFGPSYGNFAFHVGGVAYDAGRLFTACVISGTTIGSGSGSGGHILCMSANEGTSWVGAAKGGTTTPSYPTCLIKFKDPSYGTLLVLQSMRNYGGGSNGVEDLYCWQGTTFAENSNGTLLGTFGGIEPVFRRGAFLEPATGHFCLSSPGFLRRWNSSLQLVDQLNSQGGNVPYVFRITDAPGGRFLALGYGNGSEPNVSYYLFSNSVLSKDTNNNLLFKDNGSNVNFGSGRYQSEPKAARFEFLVLRDLSILISMGTGLWRFRPQRRMPSLMSPEAAKSYYMKVRP